MSAKIGIRLEDKNEWETRVPLVPADVKKLVKGGVDICVQRFPRRAFPDEQYEAAGARLADDVSDCDLVFGVKEIPLAEFQENRAYMFFSHTIKGQPYNMDMLAQLVEKKCTLLDYETVKDDSGCRLIFFGRHAGIAGAIDTLWTLGERLKALGHESPFLDLEQCRHYSDIDAAIQAVKSVGERIRADGLPDFVKPLAIGITGYGNVSGGAQEIIDLLPTVEVSPDDLPAFVEDGGTGDNRIAKVVYKEQDLVEPIDADGQFDLLDYYDNGGKYKSKFGRHLDLLTVLVNGTYWNEQYPKLADENQLRELFAMSKGSPRLMVVGDITCDVDGSLACTVRDTDPGDPCYVYDPSNRAAPSGFEGPGLAVMAIGNLPCELPVSASLTFSKALTPYLPEMAAADWQFASFDEVILPDPIKRSVILWHGAFTNDYEYMEEFLR